MPIGYIGLQGILLFAETTTSTAMILGATGPDEVAKWKSLVLYWQ
jgi:hypothetical protein